MKKRQKWHRTASAILATCLLIGTSGITLAADNDKDIDSKDLSIQVEIGFNGPTRPSVLSELEGIEPVDRTSMNAFEEQAFSDAVKATGRKRLIIGGLHTEICLTNATTSALKEGYDAMFVADAVGGRSQTAHRTAITRLSHAGAVPSTALAVVTELFRDWATPQAGPANEVINWYFTEVSQLTDEVGVAEAELLRATASGTAQKGT